MRLNSPSPPKETDLGPFVCRAAGEKILDRSKPRHRHQRSDVRPGLQDKGPLRELRMGKSPRRRRELPVAYGEQVEVDCAWPPSLATKTAHGCFDLQKPLEHL